MLPIDSTFEEKIDALVRFQTFIEAPSRSNAIIYNERYLSCLIKEYLSECTKKCSEIIGQENPLLKKVTETENELKEIALIESMYKKHGDDPTVALQSICKEEFELRLNKCLKSEGLQLQLPDTSKFMAVLPAKTHNDLIRFLTQSIYSDYDVVIRSLGKRIYTNLLLYTYNADPQFPKEIISIILNLFISAVRESLGDIPNTIHKRLDS